MLSIHAQKLLSHMQAHYCASGWMRSGKLSLRDIKDVVLTSDDWVDADAVIDELQQEALICLYPYTEPTEEEHGTGNEYVLAAEIRKQLIEEHQLALTWRRIASGLEPLSPSGEIAQVRRAIRSTEQGLQCFYRVTERLLIVERARSEQGKGRPRWVLIFCAGDREEQRYILASASSYVQARVELEIIQDELVSRMQELSPTSSSKRLGELVADSLVRVSEEQKHHRVNGRKYWAIQAVLWAPWPYYRVMERTLSWRLMKDDPTGVNAFRIVEQHRAWIAGIVMQIIDQRSETGNAACKSPAYQRGIPDEESFTMKPTK